jgi:hypothetical protein
MLHTKGVALCSLTALNIELGCSDDVTMQWCDVGEPQSTHHVCSTIVMKLRSSLTCPWDCLWGALCWWDAGCRICQSCCHVPPGLDHLQWLMTARTGVCECVYHVRHMVWTTRSLVQLGPSELCWCSKIAEAEAAVSVNEKKWFVMHMHVQLKLQLVQLGLSVLCRTMCDISCVYGLCTVWRV